MAAPTAQEQYFLELVNRARLNPAGEAARFGIDLNQGLAAGTISAAQKQPLAWSNLLSNSATAHSSWMLSTDTFSHYGVSGSTAHQRMQNAGYQFTGSWASGENIAFVGTTGTIYVNDAVNQLHQNLFLSSGHRANILGASFKEVGISAMTGVYTSSGTNYNSVMATQNFAVSGNNKFVTGAAYSDSNADGYYSIGEGTSGITATLSAGGAALSSVAGWSTGGYATTTASSGVMQLTFTGASLAGAMGALFTLGSENVKVDLVNGNTIESSVSAQLAGAAVNLELLGINHTYGYGNALANSITGNSGNNFLAGLAGADRLLGGDGNDVLNGGAGADVLSGGNGIDYAYYATATAGVTVYLSYGAGYAGEAAGDSLWGIENLWGSEFGDYLFGNGSANVIIGAGGNDLLAGGAGADYLSGGAGSDYAYYASATSAVTVYLLYNAGYAGEAAGDSLVGIENLWGSAYNDFLVGDANGNSINGAGGNDIIAGGGGNDYLTGGAGNDYFYFQAGANGTDTVSDFVDGADYLYFALAAAANFNALAISGNGSNSVSVAYAGGSIIVQGASPITLTAADFLFA